MRSSVLIMCLLYILMNMFTIITSLKTIDRSNQSSQNFKNNKQNHISYQMQELKNIQTLTSVKISTCWRDKSCYSDESFKDLLFSLRLKSQTINALYSNECPKFKVSIEDYIDRIKNIETLSSFHTSAKFLDDLQVPLVIEIWTTQLLEISLKSCHQEYALNY